MNRKMIGITLLILMCFLAPIQVYATPQLYEYYNAGDDGRDIFYNVQWLAQTFTVGSTGHTITSVKVKMWRAGANPGTLTISIREVDVNGHPTGLDKTSGTINANTFTDNQAGAWYEISLTEYTLLANKKYAIVCRKGATDYLYWRDDSSSPTYSGGNMESSSNSGVSWSSFTTIDCMFEIYGGSLSSSIIITSSPTGSGYVSVDGSAISTPQTYTWNVGDSHTIAANSPANLVSGQSQYIYTSWSDSGAQSHSYTVTSDATVTASFQLQYYLTVTGGNSPTGQGWYNSGVNANPSNPWIWSATSNTRTALTNWSLDSSNQNPTRQNTGTFTTPNIAMSTYHTANFISITQYHLTLSSSISDMIYNQTGSQTSDTWYDSNTNSTVSATTPYILGDITFTFNHWYWSLGNTIQTNSTDNPFIVTISNYTSVIAYWSYPISPSDNIGFLIILTVGILAGILLTSRK